MQISVLAVENMATIDQVSLVSPLEPSHFQSVNTKLGELRVKGNEKGKGKGTFDEQAKVSEVSRRKITSLEAQRILSVLDETIRRVEILTLLPYILENLSRFSVVFGDSIVQVLEEYDQMERCYTEVLRKHRKFLRNLEPGKSTPASGQTTPIDLAETACEESVPEETEKATKSEDYALDGQDFETLKKERENIEFRLKHNLRSLLRLFSQSPNAFNAVRTEKLERTTEANIFLERLTMLRELAFCRLVTSPKEEREKDTQLVEFKARYVKSSKLAEKLTADLTKTQEDRDAEVTKRNDVIKGLKSTIFNVEKTAEDHNRKLISDAAKNDAAEMKNSDGKKAKLQQELIQLKQNLQAQLNAHRESELALRKRRYRMETEVENWIQNFDTDMGERQDELDELTVVYNEEKKQLKLLEESFKVLETEYNQIVEEKRVARERKEQAERELQRMIKAATVLQSLWRAYRLRKMLKTKAKKKKGKKKGKGKRGGKKK